MKKINHLVLMRLAGLASMLACGFLLADLVNWRVAVAVLLGLWGVGMLMFTYAVQSSDGLLDIVEGLYSSFNGMVDTLKVRDAYLEAAMKRYVDHSMGKENEQEVHPFH